MFIQEDSPAFKIMSITHWVYFENYIFHTIFNELMIWFMVYEILLSTLFKSYYFQTQTVMCLHGHNKLNLLQQYLAFMTRSLCRQQNTDIPGAYYFSVYFGPSKLFRKAIKPSTHRVISTRPYNAIDYQLYRTTTDGMLILMNPWG